MMVDGLTLLLILVGCLLFVVGTVGLLRLPDVFARLHALTKADTLGLGFVVAGLMLQAPSMREALKLLLVWFIAMLSATTAAQLVAARRRRDLGYRDRDRDRRADAECPAAEGQP
ncbi:MAG: cation:proton antiporter [Alphaproteobacteria bacterium]